MCPALQNSFVGVHSIGKFAHARLSPDQSGEVIAAVTHAAYLRTAQNELVWMADDTVPMHRRCLQVSSPLPGLEAGSPYQTRDHILVTGSGIRLNFVNSSIWNAPALPPGRVIAISSLLGLLSDVYACLSDWPKPAGLSSLIPAILKLAGRQPRNQTFTRGDFLSTTARLAILGIVRACQEHDLDLILEHAADLVGLGAGLTPSGDDFLGGLFFSLEQLRYTLPEIKDLHTWNYSDFVMGCKSQTNLISFTLLKDHSEGHALEPMHRFANALLTGQPVEHLFPFVSELSAVGHSTGWDLLTGFLAGMAVIFPR
jgi:hypothetical protein